MRGRSPVRHRWARDLALAVTDLPVLLVLGVLTPLLLVSTVLLSLSVVGLPVAVSLVLGTARALGELDRRRADRLLRLDIAPPLPRAPRTPPGALLQDDTGWRCLAYLGLRTPVAVVGHALTLAAAVGGAAWASYPLWYRTQYSCLPDGRCGPGMTVPGIDETLQSPSAVAGVAVLGIVLLGLARLTLRATVALSARLAAGLLGPSDQDRRIREVETSRAEAAAGEVSRLRRVERELHDGVQARLVTIGLDLDQARHVLGSEDATGEERRVALQSLTAAHRQVQEANSELRAVVRGLHPPALGAGLGTALETLAGGCRLPVRLVVQDLAPGPVAESLLYFACAELLTNAVKHSGAAEVVLTLEPGPGTGVLLRVRDDGTGGAEVVQGGGLAGLRGRLRAVDGTLSVRSPDGGPTIVEIDVPGSAADGEERS